MQEKRGCTWTEMIVNKLSNPNLAFMLALHEPQLHINQYIIPSGVIMQVAQMASV